MKKVAIFLAISLALMCTIWGNPFVNAIEQNSFVDDMPAISGSQVEDEDMQACVQASEAQTSSEEQLSTHTVDPSTGMTIIQNAVPLKPQFTASQMTEEELGMSTEDLFAAVSSSQYVENVYFHARAISSGANAFDPDFSGYNGYLELISRTDFEDVLLGRIQQQTFSALSNDISYHFLQDIVKKAEVLAALSDSALAAISQWQGTETVATASNNQRSSGLVEAQIIYYANGEVETLGGQSVTTFEPSREFTAAEIAAADKTYVSEYITLVHSASAVYNCHSYGWHQMDAENPHWIDAVWTYTSDSVTEMILLNNIQMYDIVVYYDAYENPLHSAVAVSGSGDSTMVCSKWGQYGVYEHPITLVPEEYVGHDGQIRIIVYRYHGYELTSVGNHYHLGTKHYYEYNYHCTICASSYTVLKSVICNGPPCLSP